MFNPTDENYIQEAVKRYSDTVFRVAFQYTKDRSDAEDVLQEVFLKLLKKPPQLSVEDDRLKAWLIRVTINRCKDFLRAKKRRDAKQKHFRDQQDDYSGVYEEGDLPDDKDEVFKALESLSDRDRDALYLYYYEGYTAKEIANIIGGSERAVTKRIGRAREKMKEFLEE